MLWLLRTRLTHASIAINWVRHGWELRQICDKMWTCSSTLLCTVLRIVLGFVQPLQAKDSQSHCSSLSCLSPWIVAPVQDWMQMLSLQTDLRYRLVWVSSSSPCWGHQEAWQPAGLQGCQMLPWRKQCRMLWSKTARRGSCTNRYRCVWYCLSINSPTERLSISRDGVWKHPECHLSVYCSKFCFWVSFALPALPISLNMRWHCECTEVLRRLWQRCLRDAPLIFCKAWIVWKLANEVVQPATTQYGTLVCIVPQPGNIVISKKPIWAESSHYPSQCIWCC